ncbi:peptidyl-tRNA hydrolase ICT1, mitochondrial-like isoform X1 [Phoenix dactylifera]|uniref:Peptidyl-tRNA hydrolase ICT1, mitochondrial-like isoform X1 n=1 Tax=Phoenix dactylifera TaxID=42345 RepID=A0A8B8J7W5_PHODC|nr:peptidyl-tRNA hydrolase ICT1, mitochondrial-like isoform X1 [Phoenix dactylifera]XP_026662891.1 peptidyl-tRNA hydrolase ICT1, mitochondrial-like isoform X1 [Phoenix dactylifera]
MANIRSNLLLRELCHVSRLLRSSRTIPAVPIRVHVGIGGVRCAAAQSGDGGKKVSARLSMMQQILQDAEERALSAGSESTPEITLDHVTVSFARSGGPGGQNVNKVNTKVDMRFNVKQAHWLSERVRERILQMEKNRINKDGEIVISSTKTRTQKGNIEDALEKLQVLNLWFRHDSCANLAIIDAASYVPPPPSKEQKKKIERLAAIGEQKRMQNKKSLSQKKAIRRNKESWD